jgi:hypothetical protein
VPGNGPRGGSPPLPLQFPGFEIPPGPVTFRLRGLPFICNWFGVGLYSYMARGGLRRKYGGSAVGCGLDPWLESYMIIVETSSFESLAYLFSDKYAKRFQL